MRLDAGLSHFEVEELRKRVLINIIIYLERKLEALEIIFIKDSIDLFIQIRNTRENDKCLRNLPLINYNTRWLQMLYLQYLWFF